MLSFKEFPDKERAPLSPFSLPHSSHHHHPHRSPDHNISIYTVTDLRKGVLDFTLTVASIASRESPGGCDHPVPLVILPCLRPALSPRAPILPKDTVNTSSIAR